ncbi:DUF92 domain-containing protein [candidate division KSB1 bacterium]|nr:DUF92 domain-containing protein [candidate division KSB1 bacterium]
MDWIWLGVLLCGLIIVITFSEIVRKHLSWSVKVTRKIVHVITGILIALTPFLLDSPVPLMFISSVFIVLNFTAIKKGWMPGMHATDKVSYGTFFYPISFLVLLLFLWKDYKSILMISVLIMAIADPIAALVGENIKAPIHYQFSTERKSVQGSLAMFGTTLILTFFGLKMFGKIDNISLSLFLCLWFAVIVAVLSTVFESISFRGSDNLSVPLGAAFTIHYLVSHSVEQNISFTIGVGLALLIALLSYRFKFLSASGSAATFLLGAVVFGIGKWEFSLPLLLFFVLSSLISKLGKKWKKKFADTFQKGGQRDLGQVFANGGIAGIIVLLWNYFPHDMWYFIFVGSIAAVTADTWGTEIGVFSRIKPRNILNFKQVAPGTSGGVTALGFAGGLAGSFIIVFLGSLATHRYEQFSLILIFLVVAAGLFGSVMDSYIGATIQAQYKCPNCSKITEKKIHCRNYETDLVSGTKFIDNDMVNALCALSGGLFVWAAYSITS